MQHSIFITIPVRRDASLPPIKPISECIEEVPEDEIQRPGETHRSILPDGVERTEQIDIDMGLVCRVDDIGNYNDDGTFSPTHCRVYFRFDSLPPIEVNMTRVEFLHIMNRTTQQVAHQMNQMQRSQLVHGTTIPPTQAR